MEINHAEQIAETLRQLIASMGIEARVEIEDTAKGTVFNIASPDSHLLIGQRGANLYAMQVIMHSIAMHRLQIAERFSLDVDDYRKKREWFLRETAKRALEQVKKTGRAVSLEAMPAFERRVIHAYLSEDWSVDTESVGAEPHRKIVIRPKQKGTI